MPDTFTATTMLCSDPDTLSEAGQHAIADARAALPTFLQYVGQADVERALDVFDEATAGLATVRNAADLVRMCHPDADMRLTATTLQQELDKIITEITLDSEVFAALESLDVSDADQATRTWVTRLLRDMRLAGVDRDEHTRARIRALQEELTATSQEFQRTIAADTRTLSVPPRALVGLPADYVRAHPVGRDGLVQITTDYPDFVPFMTYSRDAAAREQLWRLNMRRGHPGNEANLRRLLQLRHELATLLGFSTWAEYVTANKMIGSEQAVSDFIERISAAAGPRAERDYAALLERKRADDPQAQVVHPWDSHYLTDRVRAERFAFDSQDIRPYLDYPQVKQGLMRVAQQLFGISFQLRADVPVWHREVEVYDVVEDGRTLGRIFLDMHPRADKFSHAAMFEVVTGKAGRRLPECALLCNLPNPSRTHDGRALLQPSDVTTFFHEFGHLLHFLFTGAAKWSGVGGMSVEWDFVEAPSQLLEEWTRDATVLATFARHVDTGQPVPAETVAAMRAAQDFGKGMFVSQQMYYAALSLELHRGDPADIDPVAVEREMMHRHTLFQHPEGSMMHLSFGHLTNYSAVYYTYMWSLVIAKDLFTAFDQADLLATRQAGGYRARVLAPGSSKPAAELVRDFLGRDYRFDAYQQWLNT